MPRALLPSIGTDIVKTSRFLRLLTVEPTSNGHPTRFLDKVFSVRERAAFEAGMASRGGGWSEATAVQFVASRCVLWIVLLIRILVFLLFLCVRHIPKC